MNRQIPVIIPAYEPEDGFLTLLQSLKERDEYVVVINDGSGTPYQGLFDTAKSLLGDNGVVISHEVNKGKGRALKTAFSYVLSNIAEAIGVVTADCDGQHTVSCIEKVSDALRSNPNALVMGVRSFEQDDIPWKSRFGNNLTFRILKLLTGLEVKDTQTGLRGISREYMKELLDIEGERFEFEMRMLLESVNRCEIVEVPIMTIYDSKDNHKTHFNPIADSFKIYRILFEKFIKYSFASLSSFVLDIILFSLFCTVLKSFSNFMYAAYATVCARIISAIYNYLINYEFVFESKANKALAAGKYGMLAILQMSASAALITVAVRITGGQGTTLIKMLIDVLLFIISYQIQKRLVFKD